MGERSRTRRPVGISDIASHLPAKYIDLETLLDGRRKRGDIVAATERAATVTGQRRFCVPDWYEDSVTMLAQATHSLFVQNRALRGRRISSFVCGTETSYDFSKPVASYCQAVMEQAGFRIGPNASVFEVKHACAGGTYALLSTLTSIATEQAGPSPACGIVTMGDIARYPVGSSAEPTQGAGAVALLVEENPRLLEIELEVVGRYSRSVDDFFRPVGTQYASVRGRYSIDCYLEALLQAYLDYREKSLESGFLRPAAGAHFLDGIDYIVLHAPFETMPIRAMESLLKNARNCDIFAARREMERLRIGSASTIIGEVGNAYTASLYLCLASLLSKEAADLDVAVEGKRFLLASYGSGNTMVMVGGTVVQGAAERLKELDPLRGLRQTGRSLSLGEYEQLFALDKMDREAHLESVARFYEKEPPPSGHFWLKEIRQDGYRIYEIADRQVQSGDPGF